MGQALYRKYRSKSLDEILGQEQITQTLSNALKQDRISHAYLFTGPKGVGKTSIARILAHEINKLPYTDDSAHIDIIEIDAASNRRIDEIRELREKVYIAPTSARYKVYIIDEVHMLTKEAFNALLKTLEEPPEHVIFILATTDAHKLPDTIVSRTQRFNFRPADNDTVVKHLQRISELENIQVSPEALQMIAEHGAGSFRDSISLLDQASHRGSMLELGTVQNILGIPPEEQISNVLRQLHAGSPNELIALLDELYSSGYQAATISNEISTNLRQQIISGETNNYENNLKLLKNLIEVPASNNPEKLLEILLLESIRVDDASGASSLSTNSQAKVEKVFDNVLSELVTEEPPVTDAIDLPKKPNGTSQASELGEESWPLVLKALKAQYNTLYGVARMAQPRFEKDKVILAFEFAFHEKRIMQNSNRQILADIIYDVTGKKVVVECILDKAALPPKIVVESAIKAPDENFAAISNIFGGGELIES